MSDMLVGVEMLVGDLDPDVDPLLVREVVDETDAVGQRDTNAVGSVPVTLGVAHRDDTRLKLARCVPAIEYSGEPVRPSDAFGDAEVVRVADRTPLTLSERDAAVVDDCPAARDNSASVSSSSLSPKRDIPTLGWHGKQQPRRQRIFGGSCCVSELLQETESGVRRYAA